MLARIYVRQLKQDGNPGISRFREKSRAHAIIASSTFLGRLCSPGFLLFCAASALKEKDLCARVCVCVLFESSSVTKVSFRDNNDSGMEVRNPKVMQYTKAVVKNVIKQLVILS